MGQRRTIKGKRRWKKEKPPWVGSQENMALRAGQLELRAAQMKHSKQSLRVIDRKDSNSIEGRYLPSSSAD